MDALGVCARKAVPPDLDEVGEQNVQALKRVCGMRKEYVYSNDFLELDGSPTQAILRLMPRSKLGSREPRYVIYKYYRIDPVRPLSSEEEGDVIGLLDSGCALDNDVAGLDSLIQEAIGRLLEAGRVDMIAFMSGDMEVIDPTAVPDKSRPSGPAVRSIFDHLLRLASDTGDDIVVSPRGTSRFSVGPNPPMSHSDALAAIKEMVDET